MAALEHVHVGALDPHRFASVISHGDYEALLRLIDRASFELHGRVIWNVNSTATGGGSSSCCGRCLLTLAGAVSTHGGL